MTDVETKKDKAYWAARKKRFFLHAGVAAEKQKSKEETYERFKYLLNLTDLFRHFMSIRAKQDKNIQKLLKTIESDGSTHGKSAGARSQDWRHHRKSEKEEDAELMEEEKEDVETAGLLTESPSYIKSGVLRDYQIQGVNWLLSLYEKKLSGILADEMGLGKTLQTIAFLGYLRYVKGIDGPTIIIVPKSTVNNWQREFSKWTPEVETVVLSGNKEERHDILNTVVLEAKFDILITSYEMVIKEKAALKKLMWQFLVVDEAHRIKNEQSTLSQIIRLFRSRGRLLITGTPLQNNLHELWALLNFLLPDIFGDSDVFDQWFEQNDSEEDQDVVVQQLHTVLSPFLLRRLKSEVETSLLPKIETNLYVGMTKMQVQWYKSLLEKDLDAVNGAIGKREGSTRLLNIVMQLRKCCNHPYLFEGAEPGPPYTTDEHLIFNAGKMIVLDKLLRKKREAGSRVLIFSQMSRVLDILEDYCFFRDYDYCRIDGSTSHEERIEAIDQFNEPESSKFIFLLTTRAGGLGINLVTADTVVLYDSDWNPQADLQAMDRAHRIGQKKQVHVYRFVTENAIEEKVIERAAQKLRLDQLVIQQGVGKKSSSIGSSKGELLDMIQFGAKDVFGNSSQNISVDDDIDEILRKGEQKTLRLNAKYEKLGLDDLQKFNGLGDQSAYEWNGENFQKRPDDKIKTWINPSRRERRREQSYFTEDNPRDEDASLKSSSQVRAARPPKTINFQDHQFLPPQVKELQMKEQLWFKKKVNYRISAYDLGVDETDAVGDEPDERVREEQSKIDNATEYTEEDEELKQKLIGEAFMNWNRKEFFVFINSCARFGRDDYGSIAETLDNKSVEDVKAYAKVFWARYSELPGHEKYLNSIEAGEKKADRLKNQESLLKRKVELYENPLYDMVVQYPPNNSRKTFDHFEDRFILTTIYKIGLSAENLYDKVKQEIMESDLFEFDWFFKSRSVQEISKRANTLLAIIAREFDGPEPFKKKRRGRELTPSGDIETSQSPSFHAEKRIKLQDEIELV
ncbi:LAME_0E12948g1_1 [Lachancea meyersii CBS 8951]|uniref:LAME_0E12948g1_1 n=1 Tax=Lachancea meyersii CBS 8951 TaxID=1266667 RepID=A0A1G4JME6_9SACH|nr:LAME_0E12948g1_1 [Lachancea meyersii CBS 8951]